MELTTITIPRNLDAARVEALSNAIIEHAHPRYIALEGACEGLDLDALVAADFAPESVSLDLFATFLRALDEDPRPVLYMLDGAALGGGLGLVAAADVVIARPDALFALPEVFAGLIPATVLPWLARRVGPARARRLALGGATLGAVEAHQIGLVDELADDPRAAGRGWVARWLRADARALSEVKRHTSGGAVSMDSASARADCEALMASDATRHRVRRLVGGLSPWSDAT